MGKHRRLTAFARRTWTFRPLIALGAILLMAAAAIVYAAANELHRSGNGSVAEAGEPGATETSIVIIVTPGVAPTGAPAVTPPGDPTARPEPDQTTRPPAQPPRTVPPTVPAVTATTPVASGAVTGRYFVPEGGTWGTGFIADVELKNTRTSGQGWVVNLVYPDGVTNVAASWIGGGGDTATLSWSGHSLTVTSNNPLAPGATIILGIQFNKTGSDITPTSCQVNERICSF